MTLWFPGAASDLELQTDRGPIVPTREPDVQGGTRLTVDIPAGARWLRVEAPSGESRWTLGFDDADPQGEIDDLLAKGKQGDYEQSLARLTQIIANAPPAVRGRAEAAYGRLALAAGRIDQAEPALRRSIAAARGEGRISDEVRDGSALLWALVELEQRFGDARVLLSELRAPAQAYPEGKAWVACNEGLLALATGDQREALASYRKAERTARRLKRIKLTNDAAAELARILINLGRSAEALAILESEPPHEDACAGAIAKINRAWGLMERPDRDRQARDPLVWSALEEARAATQRCPDPHRRLVATINAAEYALETDDKAAAAGPVAALAAETSASDALTASWRDDVLGRWSLLRGRPAEARARFQDEVAVARAAGLWEETFRGEVGTGRALRACGRHSQAVSHLEAAQALLDRMVDGVPLAEGRGGFLQGHDEGVRFLIDALVDRGAFREAARIARRARAVELRYAARIDRLNTLSANERARWDEVIGRYMRIRRTLEREAEQDWMLPQADLEKARIGREARAEEAHQTLDRGYRLLVARGDQESSDTPAPATAGELALTFFPGVRGWIGFAAGAGGVVARRFPAADFTSGERGASAVLARFSEELARAGHVRIFPYGAADRIDWHVVLWRGRPLIFSHEVEYGLDVPPRAAADSGVAEARTALLISNPTGDLPATAAEVEAAARALEGWQVTRLDGAAATRDTLLQALPGATLLHFAGHAVAAGTDGISSALLLAHDARIELGDLLAMSRLPTVVVLSACDAGAASAPTASSMGLAQIFVASGARGAVAPTRPIRDDDARRFMSAFYAVLGGRSKGSLAAAFRGAALASDPASQGWRSFRLMTP